MRSLFLLLACLSFRRFLHYDTPRYPASVPASCCMHTLESPQSGSIRTVEEHFHVTAPCVPSLLDKDGQSFPLASQHFPSRCVISLSTHDTSSPRRPWSFLTNLGYYRVLMSLRCQRRALHTHHHPLHGNLICLFPRLWLCFFLADLWPFVCYLSD